MRYKVSDLEISPNFRLLIRDFFGKKTSIFIPELIIRVAISLKMSVSKVAETLLKYCESNYNDVSLSRTSEIFISLGSQARIDRLKRYFPFRRGYLSHIVLYKAF